jgi:hypothetical protein
MLSAAVAPPNLAQLPPLTGEDVVKYCKAGKPSPQEQKLFETVVHDVKQLVQNVNGSSFGYYNTKTVVQGGSSIKGTSVKGRSDIDLVLFLQNFESGKMQKYMDDMRSHLQSRNSNIRWGKTTRAGLKFEIFGIDIDLLITGKYTGSDPISYSDPNTRFYMASLVEKQVAFVKENAGPVELLVIIGIKRWIKQLDWRQGDGRPSSYLIELLVIHDVHADYESDPDFAGWTGRSGKQLPNNANNVNRLFKRVLKRLTQLPSAQVSFGKVDQKYKQEKNYLLDPANPSNNLLDRLNVHLVAYVAKRALSATQ